MDTKLKSNDSPAGYRVVSEPKKHIGGMVFFFLAFFFLAISIYMGFMFKYSAEYSYSGNSLDNKISNSSHVMEEVRRMAKNLHRYYIYYGGADYLSKPDNEKIYNEDIKQKQDELFTEYSKKADELWQNYNEKIRQSLYYYTEEEYLPASSYYNETKDFYDSSIISERDKALAELESSFDFSKEGIKALILAEKTDNFTAINGYLHRAEIKYAFTNYDKFYTNIEGLTDISGINFDDYYYSLPLSSEMLEFRFNNIVINEAFIKEQMEGYILIPKNLPSNSRILDEIARLYYNMPSLNGKCIVSSVISFILFLVSVFFALAKYKESSLRANRFLFKLFNFQPFIVKTGLMLAAAMLVVEILHSGTQRIIYTYEYHRYFSVIPMIFQIIFLFLLFLYLFVGLEYIIITAKDLKSLGKEWEVRSFRCLLYSLNYLRKCGDILLMGIYGFMLAVLIFSVICIFAMGDGGALLLLPLVFAIFYVGHRLIINHSKLCYYIKEVSEGSMSAIPLEKGLFKTGINRLNKLNDSAKSSIQELLKGERLKAELITNVSHDLKTPLTSIINYIELLKNTPSQSTQAIEYIDVLDKKSERLQVLIDDLFEAARLNSGNVELERERVDIVNLLNQAMGELNEKIEASGVKFKISYTPAHIYMFLDGKKIWRVFENLLNNIIKYSPSGSRAYISLEEKPAGVEIIFKNTSAYELNIDANDLFERFKRGDTARTTDGSGLGLSIARSIVELHGGNMVLHIDGDLFKVSILL